ncbi:MAG: GNAT family N-acetyltransferase [Proteobacteria bacterium]|nr:GNAT family N-acetyltransferase [Pseudomonadota bacterium]
MDLNIRTGRECDAEIIAEYNIAMAEETEGKSLIPTRIRSGVQNLIKSPDLGFYLVAEKQDNVVASLMITTEWSDWRNGLFWWVQSVYVHPEYRCQGVYRKLYSHVKTLAYEKGNVCGIRLYVERDNQIAQKTYRSQGMKETHYRLFEEEFQP